MSGQSKVAGSSPACRTVTTRKLNWSLLVNDPAVKHYDRQMLKAEKMFLWPDDRETWSGFEDVKTRTVTFCSHEYRMARTCFLLTPEALTIR